ncbi:YbaK/EbsC family protein [Notoacmeibacter sp. MSK16QG-6]|uniref:YbaK/EbsC family protein n=1 Tax=Notoacmeibacter sp. MSK16QG-6 TaxID=2957982 RepID=UPI0020A03F3B|nr:YbaK/EbsC family protein [Notoacmeibacter sp. MSK16QG-6]MCP1199829.1 YbaK/EbsC family protein [Notoacmeibacter sp. MSK16QG-6]
MDETQTLPKPARIVLDDADKRGIAIEIVRTEKSARSAEEAAEAVGADVGQIVKTLVFQGKQSGEPLMVLTAGDRRVDEKAVARLIGEKIRRPDAEFVRQATGFAIGGVSPFGSSSSIRCLMDETLFRFETVWAAAGTPYHVFAIAPKALQKATGAEIAAIG